MEETTIWNELSMLLKENRELRAERDSLKNRFDDYVCDTTKHENRMRKDNERLRAKVRELKKLIKELQ